MDQLSRTKLVFSTAALALSLTTTPLWAGADTEVTSPDAGPNHVPRLEESGYQSYVTYEVVRESQSRVTFEDADSPLGEEGQIESDIFVIDVQNASDAVRVITEAGGQTAEWVSGLSEDETDANGFRVDVLSTSDDTFIIQLSSTSESEESLNRVAFEFLPGQLAEVDPSE